MAVPLAPKGNTPQPRREFSPIGDMNAQSAPIQPAAGLEYLDAVLKQLSNNAPSAPNTGNTRSLQQSATDDDEINELLKSFNGQQTIQTHAQVTQTLNSPLPLQSAQHGAHTGQFHALCSTILNPYSAESGLSNPTSWPARAIATQQQQQRQHTQSANQYLQNVTVPESLPIAGSHKPAPTGSLFDALAKLRRPTADIEFSIQNEWPLDDQYSNFLAHIRIKTGEVVSGWYLHAVLAPNVTLVGQGNMRCMARIGSSYLFTSLVDNMTLRPGDVALVTVGGTMPKGMKSGHMLSLTVCDARHMTAPEESSPSPSLTTLPLAGTNSLPGLPGASISVPRAISTPGSPAFITTVPSSGLSAPTSLRSLSHSELADILSGTSPTHATLRENLMSSLGGNFPLKEGTALSPKSLSKPPSATNSPPLSRSLHTPYMRSMSVQHLPGRTGSPLHMYTRSTSFVAALESPVQQPQQQSQAWRTPTASLIGAIRPSRLGQTPLSPQSPHGFFPPRLDKSPSEEIPDPLEAEVNMILATGLNQDIQRGVNYSSSILAQSPQQQGLYSLSLEGHMNRLNVGLTNNNNQDVPSQPSKGQEHLQFSIR